ncbi:MAG: hypothetical protein U9R51_09710 [Actinomycetota bacterium]|nr:hypothetical protein [Actinomycetota bacterium]
MSTTTQFARQTILSTPNPLIDRMGTTTEHLTDLGMRQLLPHGEPQQLLILSPQPSQRIEDLLVLSPTHHHPLGTRFRLATEASKFGDEPPKPLLRTEPVGEDTASHAIEPTKRLVIARDIIDTPPSNQERLRSALPRRLSIRASSAIDIDLLVVGVKETPEPLLRPSRRRHVLPKLDSPMSMSSSQYRARSFTA